jgi:uncharacterized protein YbjT (DUF2867 family)
MKGVGKTAIVLGASGFTGNSLLRLLLNDERYTKVVLFSRRPLGVSHPRIEEHVGDLLNLDDFGDSFKADEVFCCIGTTRAKTPDKAQYRLIDYGIPLSAARLAKRKGIGVFIAISSMGANKKSRFFYNRLKGEMEEGVLATGISYTYLLRPALISGKRKEKRPGEWLARQLFKVLNLVLVGPLDKFRAIHPDSIARCMAWLANNTYEQAIVPSDQIRRLAAKYQS